MQSIISQEIPIIDTIIGEIRYLLPSNIMKCFSVSYNTRSTNTLLIEHQQTEHQKKYLSTHPGTFWQCRYALEVVC